MWNGLKGMRRILWMMRAQYPARIAWKAEGNSCHPDQKNDPIEDRVFFLVSGSRINPTVMLAPHRVQEKSSRALPVGGGARWRLAEHEDFLTERRRGIKNPIAKRRWFNSCHPDQKSTVFENGLSIFTYYLFTLHFSLIFRSIFGSNK